MRNHTAKVFASGSMKRKVDQIVREGERALRRRFTAVNRQRLIQLRGTHEQ